MNKITLILPTEVPIRKNEEFGLWARWQRLIDEYKKHFGYVEIFSCDSVDYSEKLGIKHIPCKMMINKPYLRPIIYNIWLLLNIKKMKGDVLRFFGSIYPIMPILNLVDKRPKVISYQYDFFSKTLADFGAFRGFMSMVVEFLTVKFTRNIITTTQELNEIVFKRYRKNSFVNPNFVEIDIFKPSDTESNFLFFAGRVVKAKGIDYILQMMEQIAGQYSGLVFYIAGSGENERYQKIISSKGLDGKVILLGNQSRNQLAKYMSECKLFVFPTTTEEGHPKALIEALASGAACIATKVKGNTEVIKDYENGLLIEPNNLTDLIEKVKKLLNDDGLRKKVKINARKTALQYDITQVVKNEVDYFQIGKTSI